jgi:hypothetical protein
MARGRTTKPTTDHKANGHAEGPQPFNARDREAEIRERAYAIWENEGKPDGQQHEHWERAERQINGEFEPGNVVIEGDDMPKLVESDLEDADQREATPGIKEQP